MSFSSLSRASRQRSRTVGGGVVSEREDGKLGSRRSRPSLRSANGACVWGKASGLGRIVDVGTGGVSGGSTRAATGGMTVNGTD